MRFHPGDHHTKSNGLRKLFRAGALKFDPATGNWRKLRGHGIQIAGWVFFNLPGPVARHERGDARQFARHHRVPPGDGTPYGAVADAAKDSSLSRSEVPG